MNVYGPSDSDSPVYFEEVSESTKSLQCDYIIMGGDFNVVQDPELDRYSVGGGMCYKQNAAISLQSVMEDLDLIDIWREQHMQTKRYTWFRRKLKVSCYWIDYFLLSDCLVNKTGECHQPSNLK